MNKNILEFLNILITIILFSLIGFSIALSAISIQNDLYFGGSYGIIDVRDISLTPTSTVPASVPGKIYYNSSDQKPYIFDGSNWTELGGGGTATGDFVSKTGDTMTGKLTMSLNSDDMITFVRSGVTEQYTLALGSDGTLALKNETGIVRLRIDSSGNIGIGTTTPFSRLHIKDGQTWGTDISLEATDGTRWLLASTNNTAAEGPGKFLIKDNNTPDGVRMIIDAQSQTIDVNSSTIKNLSDPISDFDIGTKHYVDNLMPPGTILMYSGTGIDNADIRTEEIGARPGDLISMPGWYVCNGQSSTPDLRNKFIRSESQAGNTGGSDDAVVVAHTHTGIADSDGFHTHTGVTDSAGEHTHTGSTNSAGAHSHTMTQCYSNEGSYPDIDDEGASYCTVFNTNSAGAHTHNLTIDSAGNHSHSLIISNEGAHTHNLTINSEGVDGTGKNMPSYYGVIFITKP